MPTRDERVVLGVDRYEQGEFTDVSRQTPFPVEVLAPINDITATAKQVVVNTTATLIAEANPHRVSIMLTTITGAQITYVGFSSSVAATNGDYFAAVAGVIKTYSTKDAIWGIAASAAQTLSVVEESRNSS